MIKVRKDNVRFKGSIPELCSELGMLCRNLRKAIAEETTDEIAKDFVLRAVKLGLKTDEELKKEADEICRNLENFLEKFLDKEGEANE